MGTSPIESSDGGADEGFPVSQASDFKPNEPMCVWEILRDSSVVISRPHQAARPGGVQQSMYVHCTDPSLRGAGMSQRSEVQSPQETLDTSESRGDCSVGHQSWLHYFNCRLAR